LRPRRDWSRAGALNTDQVSLSLLGVEVANRARFIPALIISCDMCGHEVKAAMIAIASVS
jgi:hypothetical protein